MDVKFVHFARHVKATYQTEQHVTYILRGIAYCCKSAYFKYVFIGKKVFANYTKQIYHTAE